MLLPSGPSRNQPRLSATRCRFSQPGQRTMIVPFSYECRWKILVERVSQTSHVNVMDILAPGVLTPPTRPRAWLPVAPAALTLAALAAGSGRPRVAGPSQKQRWTAGQIAAAGRRRSALGRSLAAAPPELLSRGCCSSRRAAERSRLERSIMASSAPGARLAAVGLMIYYSLEIRSTVRECVF